MMFAKLGSRSLFRSTAITLAIALVVFQAILFTVSVYFIMLPMAKRSADDLASLIVLSAQTWTELPPETRKDFEQELARKHNLWLFPVTSRLPQEDHFLPYLQLLENALTARLEQPVQVKVTEWEQPWYWVEIPAAGKLIRIGFPKEHIGVRPPMALLLALIATILLTLVTAVVLAQRMARPLAKLSEAATRIGQGATPQMLAETGPIELASLSRTFNHMAQQVNELLENRTTLLAGVSHDLRTPLARMRIAVEMLPENADAKIVQRLKHDLNEMNSLIGEFLELSRGLKKEPLQQTDLNHLLAELVQDARNSGANIQWEPQAKCESRVGPMAIRRILANLIENGARYGEGKPVTVACQCSTEATIIRILDRGFGIPADQAENVFRPFYRLESSRSSATGGSGLGLAIARQLADANGWQIQLLPREGGGTEARLVIPR